MEEKGFVNVNSVDGVSKLTFYHPKSNSLPTELLKGLADEFQRLGDDDNTRVIILQSEGEKTFCAGASFDELVSIHDFESAKKFFMGFGNIILAMINCPKLIISRVHGKVVGGGLGIVSASDYSFAHKSASIRLSEFSLGIGPYVIAEAVEKRLGKSAFSQMTIDTEWYDARWAESKGLFAKVFDTIEELDENVNRLSSKIVKTSPEAATELKKIFWHGTEYWESLMELRAEIVGRLVLSEFTRNYLKQFIVGKQ